MERAPDPRIRTMNGGSPRREPGGETGGVVEAIDWFALEGCAAAELVKVGLGRRTWRVRTDGQVFYVKSFDAGRLFAARVGRALGLDSAEREWRTLTRAAALGVAVPAVVGGVRRGPRGEALLLTEEVAGGRTLAEVWRQDVEARAAQRRTAAGSLIRAVATAFADAHGAGFVHRDVHPDNLLIAGNVGSYRAVFVDVRGARVGGGPAGAARRARCLAQLDHYLRRRATRGERRRFLAAYHGDAKRGETRAFIGAVLHAEERHARALARRRDRRLRGDNKYFATVAPGGRMSGRVALKLGRRHVFPESETPDRTAGEWDELLAPCRGGERPRLPVVEAAARTLMERVRWTVAGSPARRAFLRCHRLRHRDVQAELVLGYLEHHDGLGLVDRAFWIGNGAAAAEPQKSRNIQVAS